MLRRFFGWHSRRLNRSSCCATNTCREFTKASYLLSERTHRRLAKRKVTTAPCITRCRHEQLDVDHPNSAHTRSFTMNARMCPLGEVVFSERSANVFHAKLPSAKSGNSNATLGSMGCSGTTTGRLESFTFQRGSITRITRS